MECCILNFYFVQEGRCPADPHCTAFQLKDGCKSSKIIAVPVMEGGGGIIWWQA